MGRLPGRAPAISCNVPSKLHDAVRQVVNAADPVGLIAIGCPEDEYEPEIRDFQKRIEAGEEPSEDIVREVTTHWFGRATAGSPEAIQAIALGLSRLVADDR